MSLENHSTATTSHEEPSLRSIQEALGITRYDIRPHITALIDNPESEIDAPPKVRIATLEALLIDKVWDDIRDWISQNHDVKGLAHTNMPVIMPGMYTPENEAHLPQRSTDAHIWPLTLDEYRENANVSYERFTRDVMQFHLLQWELRMKERLQEKGASELHDEVLYTRYVQESCSVHPLLKNYRNPATTKMSSGFGFGQSMFWRMPDSSHQTVMPKLGHLHLIIIETIESILRQKGESTSLRETGIHSVLSADFLDELAGRRETMQQELSSNTNVVNFVPIATGCPAVHTRSFAETGEWIRNIRADQARILATQKPSSS